MAKKSMIAREKKRARMVARYAARRAELKELIRNPKTSDEDRWQAQIKLQSLPRDASPVRRQNRCQITGRPHAYMRKFGLSRNKMREYAGLGQIPGVVRSSW